MLKQNVDVVIVLQHNKENNMIHGIYMKSTPKGKWHLISVSVSAETANNDVIAFKKQIEKEHNDYAEVAVKSFESGFYIPEMLSELTTYKPMYN